MILILNKNVIILCAGKGTRFGETTKKIPKPLIKVKKLGNKPILYSILSALSESEYKNIWVVKGYLSGKIESYISSLQSKKTFPDLTIETIDSKQDYTLGPLHSFLSIRRKPEVFKENSIYLVIPGDTILQTSFLRKVSRFIDSQSDLLAKYPVLFYQTINGKEFLPKLKDSERNSEKSISILHSKPSKPHLLEAISTISISQLNAETQLKQLYPCFLLTYSSLQKLLTIPNLQDISSITQLINGYSEGGKKVYIKSFKQDFDFYDIDFKSDLHRIK